MAISRRADMKTKLEQLLGAWKYTQPSVPAFPKVEAKGVPGVFLATKADVTQTFFNIGHLGGEFRDPDYPALEVAAQILGGGFSSRLLQRIRNQGRLGLQHRCVVGCELRSSRGLPHFREHAIRAHRGYVEAVGEELESSERRKFPTTN